MEGRGATGGGRLPGADSRRVSVRPHASVLHLDLDAFFASVEQRDKPSLRGKPVVVGGTGGRGVVATASYEARRYGVRSAMSTREARARCPHAAFLSGRFWAYREASEQVMRLLRELSPLVEPLSLDEAFVDLAAADLPDLSAETVAVAEERLASGAPGDRRSHGLGRGGVEVRGQGRERAGQAGRARRGAAGHGAHLAAPDARQRDPRGRPGHRRAPAPGRRPHRRRPRGGRGGRAGATGRPGPRQGLFHLARAHDDRAVVSEREAKSVSVEGTYDTDLTDRRLMEAILTRQAGEVATRLRKQGLSGRTVTIKVRLHDFTTLSRSSTLASPIDAAAAVARPARPAGRPRHLRRRTPARGRGLGSGRLGAGRAVRRPDRGRGGGDHAAGEAPVEPPPRLAPGTRRRARRARPRVGVGLWTGVVTVRFETTESPTGPVRSFPVVDPALRAWRPPEDG